MPWCPKCKNEYVDGIRVCSDCGCELTENVVETLEKEGILFGTEEEMNELYRFLSRNGIKYTEVRYLPDEVLWEVFVPVEEKTAALRYTAAFQKQYREEHRTDNAASPGFSDGEEEEESSAGAFGSRSRIEDENGQDIRSDESGESSQTNAWQGGLSGNLMAPGKEGIYEDSASKAKEFKSGAYMLIITGFLGMAALGLILADVTPVTLNGSSKILTGIVMGALFIIFVIMGFQSIKSSKGLEGKAAEESKTKAELEKWCALNLSAGGIDDAIKDLPDAEEARYFKRSEYMRARIVENFTEIDPAYLDHFVDEIYPNIFEG